HNGVEKAEAGVSQGAQVGASAAGATTASSPDVTANGAVGAAGQASGQLGSGGQIANTSERSPRNAPAGGNAKPARDSGKPTAHDNSRPRSSHQSLGDFGTSGNADARGNANAWGNVDSRHVQAGGDASASTSADASMTASTPR